MMIDNDATVVAQDMERVFSGLSGPSSEPRSGARPRPWWTRPGAGLLICVALMAVALIVGSVFVLRRPAEPPAPPPPRPAAAPPRPAPPAAIARVAPAPAAPAPVVPIPTAPAPVVPPPARLADAPVSAKASPPDRATRTEKPASKEGTTRKIVPKQRKARTRAVSASAPDAPPCQGASDREACFYREVMKADHDMRQAYDRAVAARVPVSDLVKARKAWKTALSRSTKEPLASIRTLDDLTADLFHWIRSASSFPE